MTDWQPIETAPHKVDVLVCNQFTLPDGTKSRSIWVDFIAFGDWALYPSLVHICEHPTHWMPLPDPPK